MLWVHKKTALRRDPVQRLERPEKSTHFTSAATKNREIDTLLTKAPSICFIPPFLFQSVSYQVNPRFLSQLVTLPFVTLPCQRCTSTSTGHVTLPTIWLITLPLLVCLFSLGGCRRSPMTTGGEVPLTQARLSQTVLTDIREPLQWHFDATRVLIRRRDGPLPADVTRRLLGEEVQAKQITATWQLDEGSGTLRLTDLRLDGHNIHRAGTENAVSLDIAAAGAVRVDLDSRQYNLRAAENEVVVYTALDREFSEPILQRFAAQTGVRVRMKFDTESTKTVGLTAQILAESQGRPRCDVFWNNEILNTLRLDQQGLLAAVHPSNQDDFPAAFRSPENTWFGFAARARILLVNTELVATDQMPDSILSLADPRWKGQVGIAKPLFGTTASHAACLFQAMGEDAAKDLFRRLKANAIQIVSGNRQVAADVARGRLAFGLTDTDDAMVEIENGFPVQIVYPDTQTFGTLFLPNTVCVLADAPHPWVAKRLLDFVYSSEVEQQLARGKSAQIPLSQTAIDAMTKAGEALRVATPSTVSSMDVDFTQSASRWEDVGAFLKSEFFSK